MKKIAVAMMALLISLFMAGALPAQEKAGPGKFQQTCPMRVGQPINPNLFVDYKGHRIYFCCAECLAAFNKDPEKYLKSMIETRTPLEKSPAAK